MLPPDKVFVHRYSAKITAKVQQPSFKNESQIMVTFARRVEAKPTCVNQYENVI